MRFPNYIHWYIYRNDTMAEYTKIFVYFDSISRDIDILCSTLCQIVNITPSNVCLCICIINNILLPLRAHAPYQIWMGRIQQKNQNNNRNSKKHTPNRQQWNTLNTQRSNKCSKWNVLFYQKKKEKKNYRRDD